MTTLNREIQIMQNPALGAVALWRFSTSYSSAHPTHSNVPVPLIFLILPVVWHDVTATHARDTRIASGLRAFASKFAEPSNSQLDILLDLHQRTARWRSKTRDSLRVALAFDLLRITTEGQISPNAREWKIENQAPAVKRMCSVSEKFGAWLAPLSFREISLALHIRF